MVKLEQLREPKRKMDSQENLNESYAESIERAILNNSIEIDPLAEHSIQPCDSDDNKSSMLINTPTTSATKRKISNIANDIKSNSPKRKRKCSINTNGSSTTMSNEIKDSNNSLTGSTVKNNKHVISPLKQPISITKLSKLSSQNKSPITKGILPGDKVIDDKTTESLLAGTSRKKILFPKRNREMKQILTTGVSSTTKSKKAAPKPLVNIKSILMNNAKSKSPKKNPKCKSKSAYSDKPSNSKDPSATKKVNFSETSEGQLVDLAKNNSIEAMTELVRQKRIRPPYGQPYSVTGECCLLAIRGCHLLN